MSLQARQLYLAEPASIYLVRPPLVVDCSILSAAIFNEETRLAAIDLMTGKKLYAPHLLDHEIISVALKKGRLGQSAPAIGLALSEYLMQAIEFRGTDPQSQYELALRYGLSGYDAAYLWLAAELKAPLATFDKKLATAASAHLSSLP